MTTHKGFAPLAILLVIGVLVVLGGGAYVVLNPKASVSEGDGIQTAPGDHPEEDHGVGEGRGLSAANIHWKFDTKAEKDHIPQTMVSVQVGETVHEVGTFEGSCAVMDGNGGVDGKGLLAGELSAAQCWFAGGGDEIGVFAHEDGGYQILVGTLEEPIEGGAGFRGDFKLNADILP